jgi:hypothetical protein
LPQTKFESCPELLKADTLGALQASTRTRTLCIRYSELWPPYSLGLRGESNEFS